MPGPRRGDFFFLLHPQTHLSFWNLSPWNTEHERGRTVFSVTRDSVAKEQLGALATPLVRFSPGCSHLRSQGAEPGGVWGLGRAELSGTPPLTPPPAELGRARAPASANGRGAGRSWQKRLLGRFKRRPRVRSEAEWSPGSPGGADSRAGLDTERTRTAPDTAAHRLPPARAAPQPRAPPGPARRRRRLHGTHGDLETLKGVWGFGRREITGTDKPLSLP